MKPGDKGWLAISIALLSLAQLGISGLSAVLPELARYFSVSAGRAGITISCFLVTYGLSQLVFGPGADRLGRLPVLRLGLLMIVIGSVLSYCSTGFPLFLLGRMVQGAGSGALSAICKLLLRDIFSGDKLKRPYAILNSAAAVTPALSPLLGAGLEKIADWHYVPVFNCVYAVSVFLMSLCLPETLESARSFHLRNYLEVLRSRNIIESLLLATIVYCCVLSYNIAIPVVLNAIGIGSDAIGLMFVVPAAATFVGGLATASLVGSRYVDVLCYRIPVTLFVYGFIAFLFVSLAKDYFSSAVLAFAVMSAVACVALAYGLIFPILGSQAIVTAKNPGIVIASMSFAQLTGSGMLNWAFASLKIQPLNVSTWFFGLAVVAIIFVRVFEVRHEND